MARTYGLHLVRRSLGSLTAALGLVLVVFLAERMTGFVEMLIERQASLGKLPLILALTAPEIVITAMPIAVLIGAFRALTEARDGGETVVLAGAGVGPWGMVSSLLGLGFAALAFVVVVAGWVDPMARAARDRLFLDAAHEMVVASVRQGLAVDRVETQNGYAFVSPSFGAGRERRILVFFPPEDGVERIVAARNYDLDEIGDTRQFKLRLHDVAVTDLLLSPGGETGENGTVAGGSGYRLGTLNRDIDLDKPLREPVLADSAQYRTLTSLIRAGVDAAKRSYGLRAAEILTRAWLTVVAVLAAAIAASFADGRRRFVVLPIAGTVMVVFDIVLVRVVRGLGAATPLGDTATGAAAVALLLAVLAVALRARYSAVVAPTGGRS